LNNHREIKAFVLSPQNLHGIRASIGLCFFSDLQPSAPISMASSSTLSVILQLPNFPQGSLKLKDTTTYLYGFPLLFPY